MKPIASDASPAHTKKATHMMRRNVMHAWFMIAVCLSVYCFSGMAQPDRSDGGGVRANRNQKRIDELLAEPNYSPAMREAREAGYIAFLRGTPGENVSKFDRGERMTDEEFRNVRKRLARMYQVEGDAIGRLALGEGGRFFLQPFLTAIQMYEVVRPSPTQLDVVYIAGLDVLPIARIEQGGGISRENGVIKDWDLPQFPVHWPFLDEEQVPQFPTEEMFKGGDMVVEKSHIPAQPVPADALGWAYPLACGGMLGADKNLPPPAGDLLWIRPRSEGGLTIEYTGPNKMGTFAWVDGGLRIHWAKTFIEDVPDDEAAHWSIVVIGKQCSIDRYLSLPPSGIITTDLKNYEGYLVSGEKGNLISGTTTVRMVSEMHKMRMKTMRGGRKAQ